MTTDEERPSGYRFSPRTRPGLFARLPAGAVLVLGLSLAAGTFILRAKPARSGLLDSAGIVMVGVVVSVTKLGGRYLLEWCGAFGRFVGRILIGRHRLVARMGQVARLSAGGRFIGLSIAEMECAGTRVGVVYDEAERTLSVALSVTGSGFPLADLNEQRRAASGWSAALAALASRRGIYRLKWIHLRAPEAADRFRARLAEAVVASPQSPGRARASISYDALCSEAEREALFVEELVVVSTRVERSLSSLVGKRAHDRVLAELSGALFAAERQLSAAGLRSRVLTRRGLISVTRRLFAGPDRGSFREAPWPASLEERWECVRTDGSWHATFWVAEWPRSEVPPGFLLPLLTECSDRTAVCLVLSPVRTGRAERSAEQRRTSSFASADLRRRYGFQTSSRLRIEHDAVLRREEELAAGHAAYEFSGFVTVSAETHEALEMACERTEQAAARSHLQLRRLFGAQQDAISFSLVNGRGTR